MNSTMTKGSWTFAERLRELRERLGYVKHGAKAAMGRALGLGSSRFHQWEAGINAPRPEAVREAVARLGVHEEEQLVAYLLDTFGTVPPPAWWNQRCPVPRVKDGPWVRPFIKTPPPKPGERPWLPNQDLLDVTDPDRIDEDEPDEPEPEARPPEPPPDPPALAGPRLRRVRDLASMIAVTIHEWLNEPPATAPQPQGETP